MDPAETNRIGDLRKARAHWASRDTILWPGAEAGKNYRLYMPSTVASKSQRAALRAAPRSIYRPILTVYRPRCWKGLPGLIVMTISDRTGADLDPNLLSVVVFFNADKVSKVVVMPEYTGFLLELHPIQRASAADQVVRESGFDARSGTFTIPARTAAVFVEPG